MMIDIINISKSYKKNTYVLEDVSLRVGPNSICCLLGKNGAGKSTLINIISRTIKEDKGEVLIKGKKIGTATWLIRKGIGLVNQFDYLIDQLSGRQYLNFQCLLFKIPATERDIRIRTLSEYFFDGTEDLSKLISSYSSGMRMKLRIIACLIHKPSILLLDEPFAHLDPVSSGKLVILLNEFREKDSNTVLVSSHDLLYVEKIATQICVINNARVVFDGTRDEFTRNNSRDIDKMLIEVLDQKQISTKDISWLFQL
jgi:ABC-2 type transport system ATP-binding protein